jgi:hypothetical protein
MAYSRLTRGLLAENGGFGSGPFGNPRATRGHAAWFQSFEIEGFFGHPQAWRGHHVTGDNAFGPGVAE